MCEIARPNCGCSRTRTEVAIDDDLGFLKAPATRPQLASWPAMHVFTNGEFATVRAARSASSGVAAPLTFTVTSLLAPSPSAAIWRARFWHTASSATWNSSKPAFAMSASYVLAERASRMHVSLVDVSPSTVTLLKLLFTAFTSASCARSGVSGKSVVITEIIVAMFGMIMPEPLAIPPTVNTVPAPGFSDWEKVKAHSFGCVSVVMMARAAS